MATSTACSHPNDAALSSDAATTGSGRIATTGGYSNPFAYCRAVGTIDHPDGRYIGSEPPPAVIEGLEHAFRVSANAAHAQAFSRGTFWRCMGGAVYACNVGANLPCESRANSDRIPTSGEHQYCNENHDALFIPMYVTGHDTIYDWRCRGALPVADKTLGRIDERGYIAGIWYPIPPPASTHP
ncbi:MAG: hypothetical protein ACRES7_04585 [Gammaproteobacteria bacterium]